MRAVNAPKIFKNAEALPKGIPVIEVFEDAIRELFFIEHPSSRNIGREDEPAFQEFLNDHKQNECWVYYEWRNAIVHTVTDTPYFRIRTARNKNIITEEEQKNFRDAVVGIAGLSVGSAVLNALVMSGGPRYIKLADFDTIEISNLNRVNATLLDIGKKKAVLAAQKAWEIDPFALIDIYKEGLTEEDLEKFLTQEPRIDVFIDEMDTIPLKFLAREICKKRRIPVLMATDHGNSVLLDVERFDLESEREIFHGRVSDINHRKIEKSNFKEWIAAAIRIIGPENIGPRLQESIDSLGKTLRAVPQLGTTALVAGSMVSLAIKQIVNKEHLPSGRYSISLEEKLWV